MTYIKQMKNEDCNNAICRVFDKIDIEKIKKFINGIEVMSNVRKDFYIKIIEIRYESISGVREKIK